MKAKAHINREMIAHWRRVDPELDRIRRRELRDLNHKECFVSTAMAQTGLTGKEQPPPP
jgi:hypothetical protein